MIDGTNDDDRQAGLLAEIAYRLGAHVNLIPLNPTPGWPTQPSPPDRIKQFARILKAGGVNVTIRDTRGARSTRRAVSLGSSTTAPPCEWAGNPDGSATDSFRFRKGLWDYVAPNSR
jgi:23S rRNA (adenine2503-C2)-methyltransferase